MVILSSDLVDVPPDADATVDAPNFPLSTLT